MGKNTELLRLDKDIRSLWANNKEMENKLTMKVSNIEAKLNNNYVNLELLSKDVKSSIASIKDFIMLFETHDKKEMEKYESIEVSLQSLDKKVSSYMAVTDIQTKDIGYLKYIAEKGKVFMIRGTWTITVLGTLLSAIYLLHPIVEEYIVAKAARDGRLNQVPRYSAEDKAKYYDKIVADRLPKRKD